ncbi:MAG: alpha-hydroxy-acid oxidizing protein [Mogibacterium sp.]|nr:alpha-hydroxy-acid oxidizing protein [Mogibacterium sp.]
MNDKKMINPADANEITRKYLDSILIEERIIDAQTASLETEIFGQKFSTPIMMPAFSFLRAFLPERENAMIEYSRAARNLGMVNWVGMTDNNDFGEVLATGARTVRVIKPFADTDKVFDEIAFAEKNGAFAVGMDIDHVFGDDGGYDVVADFPMKRQTQDDLRAYVASTQLPFVVKGVLSVSDAVKCAECGVRGIVVSHHRGRMPFAIPPLMVLPEICKALEGSNVEIFVDCGINSGADAYKALAMGAKAVSVGRAIMPSLSKEGTEGVEKYVRKMNQDLALLMGYTGCASTDDLSPDTLWLNGKRLG